MNILLAINSNYVSQTKVLLKSIIKSNPNVVYDVYILYKELKKQEKELILSSVKNSNIEIHFIKIDNKEINNFPVYEKRYPIEIYFRLFASKYLPKTIDKILYLDVDTVVRPFDTKLITPATQSFEELKMKDRIITGNMRVYEGCPVLVRHNIKGNRLDQIPNDIILTYITQNPFSQSSISGWEGLHNSGNNNIIVGIYGNVFDKDAEAKIKLIEALKSKLSSDDFKEDYSTLDDKYFYAIGSQRMVKKLVKTRTR